MGISSVVMRGIFFPLLFSCSALFALCFEIVQTFLCTSPCIFFYLMSLFVARLDFAWGLLPRRGLQRRRIRVFLCDATRLRIAAASSFACNPFLCGSPTASQVQNCFVPGPLYIHPNIMLSVFRQVTPSMIPRWCL